MLRDFDVSSEFQMRLNANMHTTANYDLLIYHIQILKMLKLFKTTYRCVTVG